MDLRHLRYFLALADTLHFGRAAARLHIVQPALSMQIKALEEELGAQLFRRSRRSVTLTEAGRLFRQEAERSLEHADRAREVVRAANLGFAGQLRLGFTAGAAYSGMLRTLMRALRESSPGLHVVPVEMHPSECAQAIIARTLDASLGTMLVDTHLDSLSARRMATHDIALVLPDDHPLRGHAEIEPNLLRTETFIGFSAQEDRDGMALTTLGLGYSPDRCRQTRSPGMILGLVAAGLGIAIVPDSVRQDGVGVVFRRLKGRHVPIDTTLLWHKAGEPGPRAAITRAVAMMQ